MELKDARITILVGDEETTIEVHDALAGVTILKATLNAGQFCQALSRLARTECKAEVFDLNRVGKRKITEKLEFPLPLPVEHGLKKELAKKEAIRICPAGWEPSTYFSSQNSFFEFDGREWARTFMVKWVDL